VRIDTATDIVLAGQFKVNTESRNDDDPNPFPQDVEPIEDEDEKKKYNFSLEDKLNLNNWQHMQKGILKAGRLTHTEIDEEDEEKKKQMTLQRLKEDPYFERLKPLKQDKYPGLPTCWIIKSHGDLSRKQRHLFKKDETTSDVVISIRSLIWPGMVHVFKDLQQTSIYVGDGMKYEPNTSYFHKFPYLVMTEPKERKEIQDPVGPEEEKKDDKKDDKKDPKD
jgi:hypothetical protein